MKKLMCLLAVLSAVLLGGMLAMQENAMAATDSTGMWEYEAGEAGAVLTAYKGTQTDVFAPGSIMAADGERLTVVKLGDGIFKDNTGLNSVTLGAGITEIGTEAFAGATNLVCIVTNEELSTIGANAFSGCTAFNSVILYDTVINIGENAFAGCSNLTIYCNEGNTGHTYAVENSILYTILNPNATPEIFEINGVEYYVVNGEARPVGYDISVIEVVIPPVVGGCPVTSVNTLFSQTNIKSITLPQTMRELDANAFYRCKSLVSVTLPETLEKIGNGAFQQCENLPAISIPDSVTSIGANAFENCFKLEMLTLSASITKIEDYCFSGCYNLTAVSLPETLTSIGVRAFSGCRALSSIQIPNNVKTIGSVAFDGCSSLHTIDLPDALSTIESSAFLNCRSLYEANIPASVTTIGNDAFSDHVVLVVQPDSYAMNYAVENGWLYFVIEEGVSPTYASVNGIKFFVYDGQAFPVCFDNTITELIVPASVNNAAVTDLRSTFKGTGIVSANLPATLTVIKSQTFKSCTHLKSVVFPSTLTTIADEAFSGCTALETVDLPEGVQSIGKRAFYECYALKTFIMPDTVTTVGSGMFTWCKALSSITLSNNLQTIPSSMLNRCTSLENVLLPEQLESIEKSAFSGCSKLASISIPTGVTYIGEYAFSDCTNLKSVSFPEGLLTIDEYAFSDCPTIFAAVIPKSVTDITKAVFNDAVPWFVYKGSYAQTVAETNTVWSAMKYHFVLEPDETPEFLEINGVVYYLDSDNAYAIGYDDSAEEITVENSVNSLPVILKGTFKASSNLKKVTIPEGISEISALTFYNCTNLTSVSLPQSLVTIGPSAFNGCTSLTQITIPENVTDIQASAFANCKNLTSFDFPSAIIAISDSMFNCCYNLVDVTIPEGVTSIGTFAFNKCTSLEAIKFPSTLTSIEAEAFRESKLRSIEIPYGVTKLERVFSMCYYLTDVKLPNSLTEINDFYTCYNIKEFVIPESVTRFYGLDNARELKSIVIPGTVKEFGGLKKAPALTTVIIEDGVETITNAFSGCAKLRTIRMPESIEEISADSIDENTILVVYENSYAHTFAVENSRLFFLIPENTNPEISYGAGISGTVTYTDGTAVAGATVEILYDDGTVKESVTTDENGAYSFTYAEVGRYTIRATDADGNTSSEVVSVKRMNAFDVFLAGETDLVLKTGWRVSGSVSPAGAATVTLTDGDGNVFAEVETTDGSFTFENVPNGSYILKAETEAGSAAKEITVFNANITGEALTIATETVTLNGDVEVEGRDGGHHKRNWVQVTVYNEDGVAVAQAKTDKDGGYRFAGLPVGDYAIVAETAEMRPDKKHHFDRSHTLTGYAHISAPTAGTYTVETIILYEENDHLAKISGKVTAHGEAQSCEVILTNVFRHEVARFTTEKNGKYVFENVRDGLYFITAVTESDGMGFAVVMVRGGRVYGNTDITVYKGQKIHDHEESMREIPDCKTREEALIHRDKIAAEKRFYDSLPEKEKKQCSKEYIRRLNALSELLAGCDYEAPEGVRVQNGGTIISGDELESETTVQLVLSVEETAAETIDENGIDSREKFMQQSLEDTAGKNEIVKYYDISLTKNGKEISNVHTHTDTTGRLRITMDIPEEYRGHKHYTFVHMHNGIPQTLVDLDDDADTVTFEVDKFSTFALTYTDTALTGIPETTTGIWQSGENKIEVSTQVSARLYIATYNGDELTGISPHTLAANTTTYYDFAENQVAFLWDAQGRPLCDKFTLKK